MDLLEFSSPPGAEWPCCEYFCLETVEPLPSSTVFAGSIVPLFIDGCDKGAERALCVGSVGSFDGGAGGSSGSERLWLSLDGPSGPRESSIASRRVACAPTFRSVLGPLAFEDLDVEATESDAWGARALDSASVKTHKLDWEDELAIGHTLLCFISGFSNTGIGA